MMLLSKLDSVYSVVLGKLLCAFLGACLLQSLQSLWKVSRRKHSALAEELEVPSQNSCPQFACVNPLGYFCQSMSLVHDALRPLCVERLCSTPILNACLYRFCLPKLNVVLSIKSGTEPGIEQPSGWDEYKHGPSKGVAGEKSTACSQTVRY